VDMETRELELRLGTEERTITGLAVPYGQDANIGGQYIERFAPGAIRSIEDVKLFYQHDEPIGKVIAGRETEAGFEIMAKVSATPRGDEVLTLMRDGVLNKFSIGFVPVEQTREGNVVTRTLVDAKEISVVSFPAYSGAEIQQVREETTEPQPEEESEVTMSENMELDVRTALDEVAELRRVVEAGQTVTTPAVAGSEYRAYGEYVKGLVSGEEAAQNLLRTATTSADTVLLPGWLGQINNLVENNRPTLNAFSRAALPAAGLTVEYAKVSSNTLVVDQQDPENEALAFGNIAIDTVSANVKTYGGYTSFSRQTIERSSVAFLDTAFRALAIQYAKKTNANVIATLGALTWTGKIFDADGGTAASLLEGISGGAAYIGEKTGLRPEFIICDPNSYSKIVSIAGVAGTPIVNIDGTGSNTVGNANVPALQARIFGLDVIVDFQLSTGTVYLANSAAVQVLESAGAPVRLNDNMGTASVTSLTNSISVYGYQAITVPFEDAIVKLDITA